MSTNNQPARINDSAYYPSKEALSQFISKFQSPVTRRAIRPGFIARTDGFDVDETVAMLEKHPGQEALLSRLLSVSDLSEKTYKRFAESPNSLYNWLPAVIKAIRKSGSSLKIPNTKTLRLPIELAQFIRLEYADTSDHDKELFNKFIFDQFKLEDDKTYFIKTGNFSSKFQFANAKCSEPRVMGEYFQVINNFAMAVGAAHSVDLVVREYIEDVENNPTIYNGMPLRTEFRVFVDFDKDNIIGTVPYWHPIVMKRALKHGLADSIQQDYQTYLQHEDKLMQEYNEYLNQVQKEIRNILPHIELAGQYSIDVMKNGTDLYVIDLALMSESALTELL
ncbi:hypothetical protein P8918_12985 [Bacillus spizizenii]|nr:hypothetical protein [Bacillus spizizenii]MCY8890485.1 hypothetical protein [Bacillus spizizenii]MEC0841940.1 hypothetical protein [Bacillus spizizenii]